MGIVNEGKLKVPKFGNLSFDESKFILRKTLGATVGDAVFFGEVFEHLPENAKEALADPDWQTAIKKKILIHKRKINFGN